MSVIDENIKLAQRAKRELNDQIKAVLEPIADYIANLNKQQLQEGENADRVKLAVIRQPYTLKYFRRKQALGKARSRSIVNLDLTGEFYNSFKIKFYKTYFAIIANPKKGSGYSLYDSYGDVTGLNQYHIRQLKEIVKTKLLT